MKHLMLFIEPSAAQLNVFTQFTLPRLGSFILAGLVNRRGPWQARVFVEGRNQFDLPAWIAENGRPDVVGISTITATVKRGYALAKECRALGIPVVLGGPHVTFLPDEALAHADLVVRGSNSRRMRADTSTGFVTVGAHHRAPCPNETAQSRHDPPGCRLSLRGSAHGDAAVSAKGPRL